MSHDTFEPLTGRRADIGDAVLTIVGAEGIRALTHRRVDEVALLPNGSASYYCRRRVDLILLGLERLIELDLADMLEARERFDDVVVGIAHVLRLWLTEERRPRSQARVELFMAASHEPLLALPMRNLLTTSFTASGLPCTLEHAATLMMMDGIILRHLREGLPAPTQEEAERFIALILNQPQMA